MSLLWPSLAAAAWGVIVAAAGASMTSRDDWYFNLKRPRLQPPDWAFGPAWTVILALAAASAVFAWRDAPDAVSRGVVVALIALNGALNILWNVLFFAQRRPDRALVEVVFLWLSILAPILFFRSFSPTASLMLVPYLLWVGFASYLNLAIARLNAPFGSPAPRDVERVRDA